MLSRSYFLYIIINELVEGSTTNNPYLRQTLVVTALSSHCVEESPTSSTPFYLSQWWRAGKKQRTKREQAGRLRKHQKKNLPDNHSSVFLMKKLFLAFNQHQKRKIVFHNAQCADLYLGIHCRLLEGVSKH